MAYQQLFFNEYPAYSLLDFLMNPNEKFARFNAMRDVYRLWNWSNGQNYNQFGSTIRRNKNRFQFDVDVHHFAPEEISVKVSDGWVFIEAKHEDKQDEHGYVTRYFTRRFSLPDDCNPELVESKLSSDGVLSISIQRASPNAKNERAIPITLTGPVRKLIKDENTEAISNGSEK